MKTWITLFLNSYLIGFAAAATLGPIAILLIQRTLQRGQRVGVASGVGVALADAFYGFAGALGLSALTRLLTRYQALLRIAGGGILIVLGARAVFSRAALDSSTEGGDEVASGLWGALVSIFLLTLSNPMTILFFSAVYAGLAVAGVRISPTNTGGLVLFPVGIFSGSLSWWLVLTSLVARLRQRFRAETLVWLHRMSGVVIAGFGVWIIVQVWTSLDLARIYLKILLII